MVRLFCAAIATLTFLTSIAFTAEALWAEGETASVETFNEHSWYCCSGVNKDLLSPGQPGGAAGDWLVHFTNSDSTAEATYTINITEGGDYDWWMHLNPFEGSYAYRIDGSG